MHLDIELSEKEWYSWISLDLLELFIHLFSNDDKAEYSATYVMYS